jgi:hypothetical protein
MPETDLMARFTTAITALLLLGCASTASGAPRAGTWLSYHGSTSYNLMVPTGAHFLGEEGDGFVPPFSLRLKALRASVAEAEVRSDERQDARGAPRTLRVALGEAGPGVSTAASLRDGASLLLRLANLRLPEASGEGAFAFVRRASAAGTDRWWSERIRNGREVALQLDLLGDAASPAAAACRSVQVTVEGGTTTASDRCSIAAILSAQDGWPVIARITRTIKSANHAEARETITFHRLPPGGARPGPRMN